VVSNAGDRGSIPPFSESNVPTSWMTADLRSDFVRSALTGLVQLFLLIPLNESQRILQPYQDTKKKKKKKKKKNLLFII
jgi:hypothetical protein